MTHKTVSIRSVRQRFDAVVQRNGWRRLPLWAFLRVWYAARQVWRRLVQDRNHVYVFDAQSASSHLSDGFTVQRFDRLEAVPKGYVSLLEKRIARYRPIMYSEFPDGGILWLGFVHQQLAACQWSRRGKHFSRWYLPLADDDVVIFGVVTFEEWRGQGLAPAMMQYIASRETGGKGRGYIDCKIWNASSIRAIEKAGFTRLTTLRPLPARKP